MSVLVCLENELEANTESGRQYGVGKVRHLIYNPGVWQIKAVVDDLAYDDKFLGGTQRVR